MQSDVPKSIGSLQRLMPRRVLLRGDGLWVCCALRGMDGGDALARIDLRDGATRCFGIEDGLPSARVYCLLEWGSGLLAGTQKGAALWRETDSRFVPAPLPDALNGVAVYDAARASKDGALNLLLEDRVVSLPHPEAIGAEWRLPIEEAPWIPWERYKRILAGADGSVLLGADGRRYPDDRVPAWTTCGGALQALTRASDSRGAKYAEFFLAGAALSNGFLLAFHSLLGFAPYGSDQFWPLGNWGELILSIRSVGASSALVGLLSGDILLTMPDGSEGRALSRSFPIWRMGRALATYDIAVPPRGESLILATSEGVFEAMLGEDEREMLRLARGFSV